MFRQAISCFDQKLKLLIICKDNPIEKVFSFQVYVVEKNESTGWRGKHCGSNGDPHQFTFDGM